MKSLGAEFLISIRRSKGVLWGVGGTVLSGLAFYVAPTDQIPLRGIIPFALAIGLLIQSLWDLAVRCHEKAKPAPPRLVQGRSANAGKTSLVLLEPNGDFYFEQFVSFYALEGSFEVLVGVGYVSNIQANGLILVQVVQEAEGQKDLWQGIQNNDATITQGIVIKPGAPKVFYDQMKSVI